MLFNGYTIKMSLLATRKVYNNMMEFAAYHSIKPSTETSELSAAGIEAIFDNLKAGSMLYIAVLVAAWSTCIFTDSTKCS
jgi:D-arabinose 1-dehydrogenase-like Zn-dependent alcohol dehydrogenase